MNTIEIAGNLGGKKPIKCGENSSTLIIASIGTSNQKDTVNKELKKALIAQDLGVNAVTDHSFYGNIDKIHRKLVKDLNILVTTGGSYEFAALYQQTSWKNVQPYVPIKILEKQILRGVDMITIHASFKKEHLKYINKTNRFIPITSKGGGIVSNYILNTGRENPYYEFFDNILSLFKKYNVTLSLGTSFRPASVCDTFDKLLYYEIISMGELVQRALNYGVKIMVEGIGHSTIGAIPTYINLTKKYCHNVPYRILPMATDAALGYDHLSGAISGAFAIASGADAITCMSRAEHIGLPSFEDLKEAIIATKIAAHCGELIKLGDFTLDRQISSTRWKNGCKGDWTSSIHPNGAKEALIKHNRLNDQLIQCAMCGDFCGIAKGISTSNKTKRSFKE